jgi:hypothetical protein
VITNVPAGATPAGGVTSVRALPRGEADTRGRFDELGTPATDGTADAAVVAAGDGACSGSDEQAPIALTAMIKNATVRRLMTSILPVRVPAERPFE